MIRGVQAQDDLSQEPFLLHEQKQIQLLLLRYVFVTMDAVVAQETSHGEHLFVEGRVVVGAVQMADQKPPGGDAPVLKPSDQPRNVVALFCVDHDGSSGLYGGVGHGFKKLPVDRVRLPAAVRGGLEHPRPIKGGCLAGIAASVCNLADVEVRKLLLRPGQ